MKTILISSGLILDIIGAVLIAYHSSNYTKAIRMALEMHSFTLERQFKGGGVPVFTGIDEFLGKAESSAKKLFYMGFGLIILGFGLQIYANIWQ